MFRDITLGQYYPGNSIIHRLDPRTKLLWTVVYIVTLFLSDNKYSYLACVLALGIMIFISKVPIGHMIKGLKAVLIILIISILFNLFLTEGDKLFSFWIFTITRQGVRRAVFMALRLICLILGTSLMTFTTTPNQLTDGIERGLGFLKVIKVPVHEIAMMMSIALRFIPLLTEELDKIIKAQTARGADIETGNFIKKAKAMIPMLIPLFVSAFRRAGELASAMEARCYHGGKGRTRMYPLKYGASDYCFMAAMFAYLAGIIILKVFLQ